MILPLRLLLVILLLAACSRGVIVDPAGPPGAIVGTIVDEDGRPLPEARIRLFYRGMEGTVTKTLRSDAKGRFSFVGLKMGPWRIEVEAQGYVGAARTVTVAGKTESYTLRLAEQPNPFCAPIKANVSIGEPDCVAAGGGS